MGKFLLRRLINYLLLVIVATTFAYFLASSTLDPSIRFQGRNPPIPQASIDSQLDRLNINPKRPVMERYVTWAGHVVKGDFMKTWDGESVNDEMGRRIGVTLRLLLIATFVGPALGVAIGAYAATRQYGWFDQISTWTAFFVIAAPTVVIAIVLQTLATGFNNAVGVQFFAFFGEGDGVTGRLQHLIVPSICLALILFPSFSRYQRSAMLDVLHSDYVRTARAKGLRRRSAMIKHALRTALIPTFTFFAYQFGLMLTGSVFVEKLFAWPGMGEWLVDTIGERDINSIAAIACFTAVLVLIAGLLSDTATALLDPRVRVT